MKISKALKAFVQLQAKDETYWVERAKLNFATGLETQRRSSKLTYKDVAERIASSAAYISKVFRGDSNLTIESMVKLARATGGTLEVRVVPEEEVDHGWTSSELQNQVSSPTRPLIAESSETVMATAVNDNVFWAAHLFKSAA